MNALILVDLQNDFMPGGALAVAEGDRVVPLANRLMPCFDLVIATQDWHPADHRSFASQHAGKRVGDVVELDGLPQILWPDHCVAETRGAALHEGLNAAGIHHIVCKGTDRHIDSYSALFDNGHRRTTGIGEWLTEAGVTDVYIMGLATEYCVKFTALDARAAGFKTYLITEGCRGVDLHPGDIERAIRELAAAGVEIVDDVESVVLPKSPSTSGRGPGEGAPQSLLTISIFQTITNLNHERTRNQTQQQVPQPGVAPRAAEDRH